MIKREGGWEISNLDWPALAANRLRSLLDWYTMETATTAHRQTPGALCAGGLKWINNLYKWGMELLSRKKAYGHKLDFSI